MRTGLSSNWSMNCVRHHDEKQRIFVLAIPVTRSLLRRPHSLIAHHIVGLVNLIVSSVPRVALMVIGKVRTQVIHIDLEVDRARQGVVGRVYLATSAADAAMHTQACIRMSFEQW